MSTTEQAPGDAAGDVFVALLRGINVGRNRRIRMADLREALTAAGFGRVRTLLQSGNVVLDSDRPAGELASSVERALGERPGTTRDAERPVDDGVEVNLIREDAGEGERGEQDGQGEYGVDGQHRRAVAAV